MKASHISPALDGAAVGMVVTAVGGLATGEADGLDVTPKVKMTLRTTLLELSAMYINAGGRIYCNAVRIR